LFEKSTYFSISVVLQRYEFAIKFCRNVFARYLNRSTSTRSCVQRNRNRHSFGMIFTRDSIRISR